MVHATLASDVLPLISVVVVLATALAAIAFFVAIRLTVCAWRWTVHWELKRRRCTLKCCVEGLTSRNATTFDAANECSVCLQSFAEGERLRVLPCAHAFHARCVDEWLLLKDDKCGAPFCPLCKAMPFGPQWSGRQRAIGIVCWAGWALMLPLLVGVAIVMTTFDALAFTIGSVVGPTRGGGGDDHDDGGEHRASAAHGTGETATSSTLLVYPGTCTWVIYQMGMTAYLVEAFDTRAGGVRVAGVSSGAVCALLILVLEAAGPSPAAIRTRASEVFAAFERLYLPLSRHPAAWVGRLGPLLDDLMDALAPADIGDAGRRFTFGLRRLVWSPLPHLRPATVTAFASREELVCAIGAACTSWPIVRWTPVARFRGRSGWCDGVNPLSLFAAVEHALQILSGRAVVTAPEPMLNGGRMLWHRLHALWNAAALDAILPPSIPPPPPTAAGRTQEAMSAAPAPPAPARGRVIWVTPTIGGHIRLRWLLRFSLPWARTLWRDGYEHARALDAAGYFDGLAPRRQ